MIKGVFFDFFDVIAPGALGQWAERHSLETDEQMREISRRSDSGEISSDEYFQAAAELFQVPYQELMSEITQAESVDEDVVGIIDRLSDYTRVLITNSSSEYVRHMLEHFELEPRFDQILVSAEIGMVKPNLDIFQTALEATGLSPAETVFIDDRKENIEGARALGMHGVQFRGAGRLEKSLADLGVELS